MKGRLRRCGLQRSRRRVLTRILSCTRSVRPSTVIVTKSVCSGSIPSTRTIDLFSRFLATLTGVRPIVPILVVSKGRSSTRQLSCTDHLLKDRRVCVTKRTPRRRTSHLGGVALASRFNRISF